MYLTKLVCLQAPPWTRNEFNIEVHLFIITERNGRANIFMNLASIIFLVRPLKGVPIDGRVIGVCKIFFEIFRPISRSHAAFFCLQVKVIGLFEDSSSNKKGWIASAFFNRNYVAISSLALFSWNLRSVIQDLVGWFPTNSSLMLKVFGT